MVVIYKKCVFIVKVKWIRHTVSLTFKKLQIFRLNQWIPRWFSYLVLSVESAFLCNDSSTVKPELRVFNYPPGYMRREPVLNYPELSMFHYGGSVKMPTSESIRLKGFMMNYWHLLNPPEVEYGGTMREIRERAKNLK